MRGRAPEPRPSAGGAARPPARSAGPARRRAGAGGGGGRRDDRHQRRPRRGRRPRRPRERRALEIDCSGCRSRAGCSRAGRRAGRARARALGRRGLRAARVASRPTALEQATRRAPRGRASPDDRSGPSQGEGVALFGTATARIEPAGFDHMRGSRAGSGYRRGAPSGSGAGAGLRHRLVGPLSSGLRGRPACVAAMLAPRAPRLARRSSSSWPRAINALRFSCGASGAGPAVTATIATPPRSRQPAAASPYAELAAGEHEQQVPDDPGAGVEARRRDRRPPPGAGSSPAATKPAVASRPGATPAAASTQSCRPERRPAAPGRG